MDSNAVTDIEIGVHMYGETVMHDGDLATIIVTRDYNRFFGSTVLSAVRPFSLETFAHHLHTEWLPQCFLHTSPILLFRMSRDGTAARDFHSQCDGMPHTITLIKSTSGCVFGGYTEAPWSTYRESCTGDRTGEDFIFSVANPFELLSLPSMEEADPDPRSLSIPNPADYGPWFRGGFLVGSGGGSLVEPSQILPGVRDPTAPVFDDDAEAEEERIRLYTGDSERFFIVAEMEVWQMPVA